MSEDSLVELEVLNSDSNEKDSKSNGLSKSNHTPHKSSEKDSPTLPFTETLQKSISEIYQESKYYSEAFPAKTSATQEKKQELKETKALFGNNILEPFAKYDPDTQSLKTYPHSLTEESIQSSLTFPESGMLANGTLYSLPKLAHHTEEQESFLLPTPTAQETHRRDYRGYLNQYVKLCPLTDQSNIRYGSQVETLKDGKLNPDWVELLMGFPKGFTDPDKEETQDEWQGCWNAKWEQNTPRITIRPQHRKNRIKCLGNAVVPQCAQAIARTIKKIENAKWDFKPE